VAMVTSVNTRDPESFSYIVPWSRLPSALAVSMTQIRGLMLTKFFTLNVYIGDDADDEANEAMFEHLTTSSMGLTRDDDDKDEEDEDEEDDSEQGDNELSDEYKQGLITDLQEWTSSKLSFWDKKPGVAVSICGAVTIVDSD